MSPLLILLGIVVALLVYDLVVPRWVYDWRARRHHCGTLHRSLSYPFGLKKLFQALQSHFDGQMLERSLQLLNDNDTVQTQIGTYSFINTRNPENIKAILSTQFADFGIGTRKVVLGPFLGEGIFTSDGAHWKHSRTMLRPVFTRERVSQLHMLEKHVQSLFRVLDNAPGYLDVQHIFLQFTQDTAIHFLFGENLDSLGDKDQTIETTSGPITSSQLSDALANVNKYVGIRRILGNAAYYICPRRYPNSIKVCHDFADEIVAKQHARAASAEKVEDDDHYSFVRDLMQYTDDRKHIRDQALTMFLAGRSTTASLMTFICFQMSMRPEMWQRLREEVLSQIGSSAEDITFESLKGCSYLNWVMNESLRLYPNVPFNMRAARKDTTLPTGGGPDGTEPVFVPKGGSVVYNVFALQRDQNIWGEDADDYRPDRWASARPPPWSYIPFNGGPRICLGQQFALTETGYVISRLAQHYENILPSPAILSGEYTFATSVSIRFAPGMEVKFVPAKN